MLPTLSRQVSGALSRAFPSADAAKADLATLFGLDTLEGE